jgi:UDP-GlcNAc:undecaprenyl-phosphate GlcNAc-1-phosphate transferase
MFYFSSILLAVFITVSLIPIVIKLAEKYQMVDFPNPRKVHTRPIPRIGGLAIALGAFIPIIFWSAADDFVRAYLAGAGILVLFGLVDDMKGLEYKAKFTGQALAALAVVFYGGVRIHSLGTLLPEAVSLPEWLAALLSIVAVIGVTNAINLADGMDGLAGGISLLCFAFIGYLGYLEGNSAVILMSLALAGAIFGFLRFNTYPASLFMGDTGSQLLGFSAVVLAVKVTQGSTPLSPLLPLIILGFPVLDTLTVMVERVREGRSPFSPDKKHFHHRLLRLGLSHAEAVVVIYLIQAVLIVAAILFKYYNDWVLMIIYTAFSTAVISSFVFADKAGFQFQRHPAFDHKFKGGLRMITEKKWVIRAAFGMSKIMIPFLFLFSCLVSAKIPGYASVIAVSFILLVAAALFFAKKHLGLCLRIVVYLTIPLVLYFVEVKKAAWISPGISALYSLSFGLVAFFALLTVKFSRRTKGFRLTTMDFLVIFIAMVVPNLPEQSMRNHHLEMLAVEIIVMLFSYEVLITELRGKFNALTASTMAALAIVGIRGGVGW